jgi:long-chain acyl-CoA synthetase
MHHAWDRPLGVWNLAELAPDHMAIAASPSGRTMTYRELVVAAHRLVHAVRARGLGPGDVIAYSLPNDVDAIVWQLMAQESGIQTIALNPQLTAKETATIVSHAGAVGLVMHHSFGGQAAEILEVPELSLRVSLGGEIDDFTGFDELVADQPTSVPHDRCVGLPIAYSSGTTGHPKAISRPRVDLDPTSYADSLKIFARAFRMVPLHGTHLVTTGMHHNACQSFSMGALNVGQSLVILDRFDPEGTLAAIECYDVATAYMVPTQFVRLLRLPAEVRGCYDISSLEMVVHSAAPCPPEIKNKMIEWWGPVIWETYGGTEGPATIAKPHHWIERPGTVGRAVRGVTIKVLGDNDREQQPGEIGRVFVEPSTPTFEYRGDPELTAAVHVGNAFTLGDIGYLDEEGFLFLCDRAKDMIISGGVNIYPAEIESVLADHPAVVDVAVIGVPDSEWGEQVKAIVQPVPGLALTDGLERELIDLCRAHLAKYKCPRSIDFWDVMPRTDQGKLSKRRLRDEYRTDC